MSGSPDIEQPGIRGAGSSGDCVLQGRSNSVISVQYVDPADAADSASDSAQLDPVQRVFESQSGSVVSNADIELVHAATGLPAAAPAT